MEQGQRYIRYVDNIAKEEFIHLFAHTEKLENWFTENELKAFAFPRNAGSLAARYLIKKRICDQVGGNENRMEMEILNDKFGKPQISFKDNMKKSLEYAGISEILCSISHSRNYVIAMIVFCY